TFHYRLQPPQGDTTLRWRRKDGTVLLAELKLSPVYDDLGELVAVDGVVRELEPTTGMPNLGGLEIDVVNLRATVDGRVVHLTPAELRLLVLLTGRPGRVVTR